MRLLQAHDGALEFRLQPGIGSQSPAVLLAAPGCRSANAVASSADNRFKRSISAAPSGPTSASATTPNAVTQRSSRDAMCSIAALPGRAPRPHIARRRIDQPGIGLEAIIGAEHRLVPMPQAHPFGGQDDHARPGVQQRPGFRQRRAPELNWARSWSTAAPRASWMRSGKTAQAARSMFQPWRRAGSARSRTAVSTATGHTPRPGRPARADRLAAHAGMPIARVVQQAPQGQQHALFGGIARRQISAFLMSGGSSILATAWSRSARERTGVARPPASSVVAMACNVARRSFRRISSARSRCPRWTPTPGGVVGVSI